MSNVNAELAALRKEREARRGPPPPPPRVPMSNASLLRLLAFLLAIPMVFAWTRRSACGCGADLAPENILKGALGGMGQATGGSEGSLEGALGSLASFGKRANGLAESCDSKARSGVCYLACRMAGMDLQRAIWWTCFRGGAKALLTNNDTGNQPPPKYDVSIEF